MGVELSTYYSTRPEELPRVPRISQLVATEITFDQLDGGPSFVLMFYGLALEDLQAIPPEPLHEALRRRGIDPEGVRPRGGIFGVRSADLYVHPRRKR